MRKLLFFIILIVGIISCQPDVDGPVRDSTVLINTDSGPLNSRFTLEGAGVIGIIPSDVINGRLKEDEELAGKVPLMMVSQVDPPIHEGKVLKATHVDIAENYAYVSYNTEGAEFLGAIEIFDITDPLYPKITGQAIFKNGDINSIAYKQGKLYAAGAFDIDNEPGIKTAAQLIVVSVSNGSFTSDFSKFDIEGWAAVDVSPTENGVIVASGSNGLVGLFDSKGQMNGEFPLTDLRSVKYGNGVIGALSGTEGIKILDPSSLKVISSINLEKDIAESKRTLDMSPGLMFASEGPKGVGVYSIEKGSILQRLSIPLKPDGVEEGDIVTNSVSFDDGKVYMANGGAGISVSQLVENDVLEEIGILGINGSSNFIKSHKGYIFVASGARGLQILNLQEKDELALNPGIDCGSLSPYSGSTNLNVNSNEQFGFSGAASMKNVNIGGQLTFCGSLAIENSLNLNSGGVFMMNGSFVFGQYNRNNTLSINSDAVMKISGSMVIYGDLNLNSGATLEFIGEGNSVTVFGRVQKGANSKIVGDFVDTENKLK
ncbi:hypothetical protein [Aquiflexum gelatinilyticum]|uniref:LVIVD repeat-containing protein n=1 Tax=Aquiflexum gelatinilyticum TaxID=2961943 RepID=A0A9X2P7W0_9BACT|nr:hypothetical protein [Aquiflexum gelatinilyticum]MCR9015117.1 hypothetical protein [Aquiflexum gelatinilyticum]